MTVMGALPKRYFTPEEYNLLEAKAGYKSQYVAGEIYSMSGAQPWHVQIESNIGGMLYNCFRARQCRHFTSNMRVRVKAGDLWTYPDAIALCGEPKFDQSARPFSLLNPQVIFEVLSSSTERFDRSDKFIRYQKLESLADYVLVSAERMQIDHYTKMADGTWNLRQYNQPADALSLASVEIEMPLAEVYEKVQFPDSGEDE